MKQLSTYDYLIIGAGPAGLQLGYYLQKQGCTFLMLEEASQAGSFYEKFPRHGQLISINKIYTGYDNPETQLRYDWNSLLADNPHLLVRHYSTRYFPQIAEYQRYLQDFAHHYQLPIRYQTAVTRITRGEAGFECTDQMGQMYQSKRLVVATGLGRCPQIPAIEGIELGEHYQTCSMDPTVYQDQRVLIIGKGNGAFETANILVSSARVIHLCSPDSVKWAWETHFMGHVRTVNAEFLDTFYLKGQNALLDARILKLEKGVDGIIAHLEYTHAGGQTMQLVYDRVLLCTGFRFDTSLFDQSCQPALSYNGKLPAMTAEWESTNIKDLYFVGTLMQMRDYQKTMSNVIHGFRFNIQFLSRLLALKYNQRPFPFYELPLNTTTLTQHLLTRASQAASLFLQPGFFCDLCLIRDDQQSVSYLETVPVGYLREIMDKGMGSYYTLTLEYGQTGVSPRHLERDPDPNHAAHDYFLHPVVRYYFNAKQEDELHLAENLESCWLPEQRSLILTTEVPGQHSAQEMFNYDQRLQAFLQKHF